MVADKGDKMGYTVAWDKDRTTTAAFFDAAGQDGIPCSFLVDQNGMIAYIGHPMEIEKTLELVMANKHDIKALAADYKKQKENETKIAAMSEEYGKLKESEDWPAAVQKLNDLIALDPKNMVGAAVERFTVQTEYLKDYAKAASDATAYFIDGAGKDNANAMNAVAWSIVDPDSELGHVDADLALKLSTRANDLMKNENASVMDTLARVYFVKGDFDKAVDIETKAVEKSADNKKLQGDLQKSLAEFKDAQAKKAKG
jgi:tetratricopeptide (TPR) repeat protein